MFLKDVDSYLSHCQEVSQIRVMHKRMRKSLFIEIIYPCLKVKAIYCNSNVARSRCDDRGFCRAS